MKCGGFVPDEYAIAWRASTWIGQPRPFKALDRGALSEPITAEHFYH